MKYDLSDIKELKDFDAQSVHFKATNKIVELKECKNIRTLRQNRALHKFFMMISEQLNELGMEFSYTGIKGADMSLRYTPDIVKEFFWKPIQMTLFEFKSTTKLKTDEMNQIIDVIVKFFGDQGVVIEFPCLEIKENYD